MTDAPHQPNIHDFPWLAEATGIDVNKLGAVMLPVNFRPGVVSSGYDSGALNQDDLYTAADPAHFWIKGDVSGDGAHVTLLYGLLTPAYDQPDTIYKLLRGWVRPAWLPIATFDVFPSNLPGENYSCIVAKIGDRDGALQEARGLLQYLPHVDTFPEYLPHATVAYVKPAAVDFWLEYLNGLPPQQVSVPARDGSLPSLDLGSAH